MHHRADDVDRFCAQSTPEIVDDYRMLLEDAQLEQIAFARCRISSDRLAAMAVGGSLAAAGAVWFLTPAHSGTPAFLTLAYGPLVWCLLGCISLLSTWRMHERRDQAVALLRGRRSRRAHDLADRIDLSTAPLYWGPCFAAHLLILVVVCTSAVLAVADGRPAVLGAMLPTTVIGAALYGVVLVMHSREPASR